MLRGEAARIEAQEALARAEAAEKGARLMRDAAERFQAQGIKDAARCATLEAALRRARHELDQWFLADGTAAYRVERAEAIIDAALAATGDMSEISRGGE